MKLGIIGCLAASAAALLFNGCAADPYAADYRTEYTRTYAATTDPVFVERRIVTVNNTPRDVPIYRTGDSYFYTWGGRRYTLADYPYRTTVPATTRTVRTRAYSSARYRTVDPTIVRDDVDVDVDDVGVVPATTRTTTTVVEPEVIGESVPVTRYGGSKEVVEIRD